MNTFWLKLAGLAVVAVILIVLVNVFSSAKSDAEKALHRRNRLEKKPDTFYDVAARDDKRLRADPRPKGWTPGRDGEEPPMPEFRELDEIQKIEAQRLFNWAIQQRKIGRLPGPSYKHMVDACREIIEKFPDTVYAFKAKRMLGDIPRKYWDMYRITDEEVDLGDWE